MKNFNDTIWNRTSDLPICSAAPHPLCHQVAKIENMYLRTDFRRTVVHTTSIRNRALHDLTVITDCRWFRGYWKFPNYTF